MTGKPRRPAGARLVMVALVPAVAAAILAAGVGRGATAGQVLLVEGAAWLPSSVGQVALISGASARPVAVVDVAGDHPDLSVEQSGADAYVVDRVAGSVVRVDGGTFDRTKAVAYAPRGGAQLQVRLGGGKVFVLDGIAGLFYRADPLTLAPQGPARPLGGLVAPGSAVADATGRLWVVDSRTGALTWFDQDEAPHRATPTGRSLIAAAGTAVLIGADGADWLAPDGSSAGHVSFDLRSGERAQVSGTATGQLLVVVAARGIVKTCDRSGCGSAAYRLTAAGARLGPAVLDAGRILVPDFVNGSVHVLDTTSGREIATPTVLRPTADFDLVQRDSVVFFNDPKSERAGVLRLDGSFAPVTKYAKADPAGHVDVAAKSQTAPPVTLPPSTSAAEPGTALGSSISQIADAQSQLPPPSTAAPGQTGTSSSEIGRISNLPTSLSSVSTPITPTSTVVTSSSSSATKGPTVGPTISDSQSSASSSRTVGPTISHSPVTSVPTVNSIAINSPLGRPYLAGDVLNFSAAVTGSPTAWAWTLSYVGDVGAKATSSATTFSYAVDSGGSSYQDWVVRLVVSNAAGRSAEVDRTFTVSYVDGRPFDVTAVNASPTTAEPGAAITVAPTIQGPLYTCVWQILPDAPTANCDQPLLAPSTLGAHTIQVTGTSRQNVQKTATETLNVKVDPPAVENLSCPATANAGTLVACTANTSGTVTSWHWSVSPTGGTGTDSGSFTFTPATMDTYTVSVYVSNAGGDSGVSSAVVTAVDTSPPTVTTDVSSQGGDPGSRSMTATVTLNAKDPESGISSAALTAAFTVYNPCNGTQFTVTQSGHRTGAGQVPLLADYTVGTCYAGPRQFENLTVSGRVQSGSATNGAGQTTSA